MFTTNDILSLHIPPVFATAPVLEIVNFIGTFMKNGHINTGMPMKTCRELLLQCTFQVIFKFDN